MDLEWSSSASIINAFNDSIVSPMLFVSINLSETNIFIHRNNFNVILIWKLDELEIHLTCIPATPGIHYIQRRPFHLHIFG